MLLGGFLVILLTVPPVFGKYDLNQVHTESHRWRLSTPNYVINQNSNSQIFLTNNSAGLLMPVSRQIVRLQQIVCHCMILEVSIELKLIPSPNLLRRIYLAPVSMA